MTITLPQEIDKAINTLRMGDVSDYGIICLTYRFDENDQKVLGPAAKKAVETLRQFTFSGMEDEDTEWKISAHDGPNGAEKLMQALVKGYQVEATPEEEVTKYIKQLKRDLVDANDSDTEAKIKFELSGALNVATKLGLSF